MYVSKISGSRCVTLIMKRGILHELTDGDWRDGARVRVHEAV